MDIVPSLSQLLEIKDKYISPALRAAQTVKSFVDDRRTQKTMESRPEVIELDDLSSRQMRNPTRPVDHEHIEEGNAQRDRIQKLLDENPCRELVPVRGPPFPDDLPKRPKPRNRVNRWKFGFLGLLLLFVGTVAPLTALLVRKSTAVDPSSTSPVRQQQAVSTVTETITTTPWNISISTTMQFSMKFQTFTEISIRTSTYTESKVAKTTGIGNDCDNLKVFLAKKNCVMVTECTQSTLDTSANDCKDFCSGQPLCEKEKEGDMSQRLFDCCSHCGCF